jgi:hypothetical protein
MKAYGGLDVLIHVILTSALVRGKWSASRPGPSTPREGVAGTDRIGGRVGPSTGLDDVERIKILNLPGLELQPLSWSARRQSLSRLLSCDELGTILK